VPTIHWALGTRYILSLIFSIAVASLCVVIDLPGKILPVFEAGEREAVVLGVAKESTWFRRLGPVIMVKGPMIKESGWRSLLQHCLYSQGPETPPPPPARRLVH